MSTARDATGRSRESMVKPVTDHTDWVAASPLSSHIDTVDPGVRGLWGSTVWCSCGEPPGSLVGGQWWGLQRRSHAEGQPGTTTGPRMPAQARASG